MTHGDAIPDGFVPFDEAGSFIGHVGPLYWRRHPDGSEFHFRVAPHQANPAGVAHGGMLATVADICLGTTAGIALGHHGVYPTVSLNLTYVSAARLGDIVRAGARVARLTKTLAFVSGELRVGDVPILLATGVYRNPPQPKSA
ncbi:MAG: PaaI family thioesterase [Rhodospirillaceae bacterium]|nr:PaaI family thioesterase [Rhodospirillaceae bacterium]